MIQLTLRQLRDSDVPIDWMTVKVGYEGFGVSWTTWHLRRDEIPECALDVLASEVGTPDEEPIFQIADADLTDWTALDRPLTLLAKRANVTRETALRKWRYAAVHEAVHELVHASRFARQAVNYWEDELYEDMWELKSVWNEIIPAHLLPEVIKNATVEDVLLAEIALLRAWLVEEYPALL